MKAVITAVLMAALPIGVASAQQAEDDVIIKAHPQWSPDGNSILFYEWNRTKESFTRIKMVDLTSGRTKTLTNDEFFNVNPVFSGESSKITYTSARPNMQEGNWEAYEIDLVTGETVQITDQRTRVGHPTVSSDGKTMVFHRQVDREGLDGFLTDLFAQNLETGEISRLTDTDANEFHPKFVSDNHNIVFDRLENDNHAIYMIGVDGTGERRLLDESKFPYRSRIPTVSPNGKYVAYSYGEEDRVRNLMITNLVSGKTKRVTKTDQYRVGGMAWSPDGQKIVYSYGEGGQSSSLLIVDLITGETSKIGDDPEE